MRAAAATVLAVALLLPTSSAHAEESFVAKKDAYLADKADKASDEAAKKAWQAELDKRVGAEPARLINIYNQWTREYLTVDFEGDDVEYTHDEVNEFLRCRFTNDPTDMDPRLLGVLVGAARHFDRKRVNLVSAYRSPKYNLILQKKGRNVSRNSQHTRGRAVDFRIPGVSVKRLHLYVRSLRLGGVGFYTHSRFIHADTARVRYWTAR